MPSKAPTYPPKLRGPDRCVGAAARRAQPRPSRRSCAGHGRHTGTSTPGRPRAPRARPATSARRGLENAFSLDGLQSRPTPGAGRLRTHPEENARVHRTHARTRRRCATSCAPTTPGCSRPRSRTSCRTARASVPSPGGVWKQMAADGWVGIGWPKEYGGQGRTPDRAVHLLRRVDARRCAGADAHDQLRRARRSCTTARRSRRTSSCPKILAGEIHFCIGYTEPDAGTDLASLQHPGRARRRRVRHQRPEDLHEPRRPTPTTSGSRCAPTRTSRSTRASRSSSSRPTRPGFKCRADLEHGRLQHQRHVLRRRAGAGRQPRRRGERGLGPHHQPAQPRAGHAVRVAASSSASSRTSIEWAQADQARRRPPRHRPGVGAAQPGPGARPARVPPPRQLEGRRRRDPRRAARPGRRVGDQGVRHRVLPRGLPAADGDPRPGRATVQGDSPECGAAGPPRGAHRAACTSSPSAAAPTRCSATSSPSSGSACPDPPAEPIETRTTPMDFTLTEEQEALAGCPPDPLRPHDARTPARARRRAPTGSTATPTRSSPRPTCSASRCPSRSVGSATASSSCAWCSRSRAAPSHRCRSCTRSSRCALTVARFGTDEQQAPSAAGDDRAATSCCTAALERARHAGPTSRRRPRPARATSGASRARRSCVPMRARRRADPRARPRRRRRRPVPRVGRPARGDARAPGRHQPRAAVRRCTSTARSSATSTASASSPTVAPRCGSRCSTRSSASARSSPGACQEALRITAEYTTDRKQFDRAIATFQAVGQRMADAYIDTAGDRAHDAPGRDEARRRRGRGHGGRDRRSSGRPRAAAGSVTPRCTCTAASASTSTTRSTATSCGSSSSSSPSAPRRSSCVSSVRLIAGVA